MIINVDFPSLTAAALFYEKNHDSCSASLAGKFKQARSRTSDSVSSQHSLPEDAVTLPEPRNQYWPVMHLLNYSDIQNCCCRLVQVCGKNCDVKVRARTVMLQFHRDRKSIRTEG